MSLLVLLLVLAAMALIFLQPWSPTSLAPLPSASPEGEAGLGDSVAVVPAPSPAVSGARVADAGVSAAVTRPRPPSQPEPASPAAETAVSVGQPIDVSKPAAHLSPVPQSPPASGPVVEPVVAALPEPAPAPPPAPVKSLVANFENGLEGWSTAAAADFVPKVVSGIVRDGERSSLIKLTGDQSSAQLILGGDGGADDAGVVQIAEGEEYAFAFSFYVQRMSYGWPGADNLVLRLKSDASENLAFGLQLWDPGDELLDGGRGLWSSGEAVGGDRYLAPIPIWTWHDVIVHFKASSQGEGFYAVYLDDELVDARDAVSLIVPGSSYAQIEVGLFRDGELVQGTSEIRLDAAVLGDSLEAVQPLAE